MSNSQGNRREIIRLTEFPHSSTPEPPSKRQRISRSTSKNIISIPRESRPRVTRSAGIVENAEPTRVVDSSERSSDPLGYRTATPVGDPQEAAIEDAVVTDSPTRVVDSSERSSEARSARVADTSDRNARARVTSSPTRVIDSSERSSQPEDRPQMATSWTLPEVTTSTGVDTGAMPTTDLEQAAWDASVMPVSTGTDVDGMSMAVVSVTGDNSDGPISTG